MSSKETVAQPAQVRLTPQPGPQVEFLSTPADIAIYGGAAGGGKTFGLLLETLRHIKNPKYRALIFRRSTPQLRGPGALWDESFNIYSLVGGAPREQVLDWTFPSGAQVKFSHMEHIKNRLDWKGAQIPLIGFDQLEDFEEEMFWYMQSRNRSTCGVPPYVRATVNPDPDSFVAGLISWWIDQATGYPIPERSGVIRWFVRMNGQLHWADTRQEIMDEFVVRQGMPEIDVQPISLTFIPAKLSDNAILCVADPSYRAKLLAMPPIDRARLLDANWKVKDTGLIRREWFPIVEGNTVPRDALRLRWSDLAATADGGDYTSSIRLSTKDGIYYIEHCAAGQWGTHERDQRLLEAADLDCALYGNTVEQCIAQDPAAAGKAQVAAFVRAMAKYATYSASESGDKRVRSAPWRSQAEAGNFRMVRGPWNEALILRLLAFPTMDDDVDAISGGYNRLAGGVRLEWWKDLAGERRKRLANAASVAA